LQDCRFWRTTGYATVQLLNHDERCAGYGR